VDPYVHSWTAPIWLTEPGVNGPGTGGCAEIDVSEQLGRLPTKNDESVHNWCQPDPSCGSNTCITNEPDCGVTLANGYHDYWAYVTQSAVQFHVDDGICDSTITAASVGLAAFNQPITFHLDMSTACSGWPGCGANPPTTDLLIDYVRVSTP
jgi:hypothetical protein